MAEDGGFWLLGLREIDPALVLGVPMSRSDTGALQLARLHQAGLRVRLLPELADVDTADEAGRIAAAAPGSRFAACVRALGHRTARAAGRSRGLHRGITVFPPVGTTAVAESG